MRVTWLGKKVLRLEVGLEHFLIAKTKQNFDEIDGGRSDSARWVAFDQAPILPFAAYAGQVPSQKPMRMIDEEEHARDLFLQGKNFLLLDRVGTERLVVAFDGLDAGVLPTEWLAGAIVIIVTDEHHELVKLLEVPNSARHLPIQPRHYLFATPAPDEGMFELISGAVGVSPAQILEPGYAIEL